MFLKFSFCPIHANYSASPNSIAQRPMLGLSVRSAGNCKDIGGKNTVDSVESFEADCSDS